jgi:hypothetical protein
MGEATLEANDEVSLSLQGMAVSSSYEIRRRGRVRSVEVAGVELECVDGDPLGRFMASGSLAEVV